MTFGRTNWWAVQARGDGRHGHQFLRSNQRSQWAHRRPRWSVTQSVYFHVLFSVTSCACDTLDVESEYVARFKQRFARYGP